MSFEQRLVQVDELQQEINGHGKLPDAVLKKINYKFRLEWNYTSNSMEGNTLTKDETRSVMIGNITVEGKPIKDILEMKGHDEVINAIIKIGKGELNLSEKRIKEIHIGIMHEEDPEKKKAIGQWKTSQNYLYNYKNERFDFVAPADVPERMHQLMNWLNGEKDKIQRKANDAMHPIELALKFNLDYVSIHPFYDGNGRTSRILTNLILITYGYPPLYIKENERGGYMQYLGDIQGYGGAPDVFFDYMAGLIIRSQQLVLDAISGKEIEEPADWEKKLQLLKAHTSQNEQLKKMRSEHAVKEVVLNSIAPLIEVMASKLAQFDDLFLQKKMVFFKGGTGKEIAGAHTIQEQAKSQPGEFYKDNSLQLSYELNGFKSGKNPFYCRATIYWNFDDYRYYTGVNNNDYDKRTQHFYHEFYTKEEIETYVNEAANSIVEEIERQFN